MRPRASIVSTASFETRPISAILPLAIARSAENRGSPVPSTIVPPLMTMSYAIAWPLVHAATAIRVSTIESLAPRLLQVGQRFRQRDDIAVLAVDVEEI